MKCKRLRYEDLHNEEWFQFLTEFRDLAQQRASIITSINDLFSTFLKYYEQADEALEVIRKSVATGQIVKLKVARGNIYRGLSKIVRAYLLHFDKEKKRAATRLTIVLDHYGKIDKKPYAEATSSICNFLQELHSNHSGDIQMLGLTEWLTELEDLNQTFESLVVQRYTEESGRCTLRMIDIRLTVNRIYRAILDKLEAIIIMHNEPDFITFVHELNIRAAHYSLLLAQRKQRHKKRANV